MLNDLNVSIERIKDGILVEINPSPHYSYKKHFKEWNDAIIHVTSVLEGTFENVADKLKGRKK